MITTSEIGLILHNDCACLGIETFQGGNIPIGPVSSERITIHTKSQSPGKYWEKGFVEVNICVPDVSGEKSLRVEQLERIAKTLFNEPIFGKYDNSSYLYSMDRIGVEKDSDLKCHYINVRILFEVLNVKKL